MGDVKSLVGYSVHKTPHPRFSDPRAWWKTEVRPINPNPPQELPPQRQRRGREQTFNQEMDVMIVGLVERLSHDRARRIPWDKVYKRFNRRYKNVENRYKTLKRNGRAQTMLDSL